MYKGKAYRNLESTKQTIKLSLKERVIMIFSPNLIIHVDVYSQAEIQGGKMLTTVDNETYFELCRQWFRKKFPKKGGIIKGERHNDGLAEPSKSKSNCSNCLKQIDSKATGTRSGVTLCEECSLAEPPKGKTFTTKCRDCEKEFEANSSNWVYCESCLHKMYTL